MKSAELVYLDTHVLQKDLRIRLPKAIISNLDAKIGETKFEIYYNPDGSQIILKKVKEVEK